MAARSSALSRSVEFFRSANIDEARVAFQLVKEVMEQRLAKTTQPTLPFNKKPRKPKAKPGQGGGQAAPALAAPASGVVSGPAVAAAASARAGAAPASLSMREQEQTLADA
jgi:hypothetical protein